MDTLIVLALGFSAGFVIRSLLWRAQREEQDATAYDELLRARRN